MVTGAKLVLLCHLNNEEKGRKEERKRQAKDITVTSPVGS
jgi:hypothetical protein